MDNLDTDRLVLRPFSPEDVVPIWRVIYGDPRVCEHYCGITWSVDEVRQWVTYHQLDTRYGDIGFAAVVRKCDQQIVGLVGLRPYVARWIVWQDAPNETFSRQEMELTYAFGREFWGQGYATEACSAVIGYAFRELRLPRLAYTVHVNNLNSWKLMRRLGFRFQRNLRPEAYEDVVGILDNTLLNGTAED